jgi:hypothetical protein
VGRHVAPVGRRLIFGYVQKSKYFFGKLVDAAFDRPRADIPFLREFLEKAISQFLTAPAAIPVLKAKGLEPG